MHSLSSLLCTVLYIHLVSWNTNIFYYSEEEEVVLFDSTLPEKWGSVIPINIYSIDIRYAIPWTYSIYRRQNSREDSLGFVRNLYGSAQFWSSTCELIKRANELDCRSLEPQSSKLNGTFARGININFPWFYLH